eukprot:CAMPEP_0204567726 /NCGR_PEP_ID=MMETSP0661-20131031/36766_1 /ASSEMBLY_ACC=CAM_ASM_000606 /TAXON_ID=109239 /ORGANISM="Alexandrium margalefi, Strain AMGDE01CS-322" /LENGTH=144 /DNA_ID=CAMNT_0051575671 /DNA_START=75 /DNA_END=509 /DNA_ORIENTATION=+
MHGRGRRRLPCAATAAPRRLALSVAAFAAAAAVGWSGVSRGTSWAFAAAPLPCGRGLGLAASRTPLPGGRDRRGVLAAAIGPDAEIIGLRTTVGAVLPRAPADEGGPLLSFLLVVAGLLWLAMLVSIYIQITQGGPGEREDVGF